MNICRILPFLLLVALAVSCSRKSKHVSAAEFQREFEMRHTQTMRWSAYLGETNGTAYLLRKTMPLVGSKWKEEVLFTGTNGLAPGLLEQMSKASKLEPVRPANGNQPVRAEPKSTSSAAGSPR
ncbi:MAG: hypothetical protein RJA22_2669 [Verrucomicrobiota bacterium]|jgi:hypothetical protein